MRLRSCRTSPVSMKPKANLSERLTGHACKQLPCKALDLTAGKGYELVAFEKIKDALAEQICYNADVISEIEAISKMYTFVAIFPIVL